MKKYFPENYSPNSKSLPELSHQTYEELVLPIRSTKFKRFECLNKITGGLRPFEFSILCGATGVGKTTLCANLSEDLVSTNTRHFVASVETGPTDYVRRVISSRVCEDWNTGNPVSVEKIKLFSETHEDISLSENIWLSLYDNRISVETLMADIAWHVENKKCKIAIIDNLNFFLEVTRSADQIIEMDRVVHNLIIFCKQIPVHVIMIMHPKKTEHGRVESEFDIKGSSTAVQEAHNVFLFNRPHSDLIDDIRANISLNDRELVIRKMRRIGKYVGRRLIFKSIDGVRYEERGLF